MTKRTARGRRLLGLTVALPLACADTVGAGDGAIDAEAPRADATAFDAQPAADAADASGERPGDAPGPPPDDLPAPNCAGRAVIDLDLAGTVEAGVVRFQGTTTPDDAPIEAWGCEPLRHPVVFRATVRAAGRVQVSTDDLATGVAVFDGCPDFRPPALACRNVVSPYPPPPFGPAAAPARSFDAGDTVYLVVGSANAGRGFNLAFGAIRTVALGERCDQTGDDFCEPGTACARVESAFGGEYRCAARGLPGGPCRAGDPATACDPGLRCHPSGNLCSTALARGASCEGGTVGSCPVGQNCVAELVGGTVGFRCVDDGVAGGRCRAGSPPCGAGSVCAGFVCQRPLAVGGACSPRSYDTTCGPEATCQGLAGAETCRADGALDGRCRAAGAPCDPPLACARRDVPGFVARCRRAVAVGEACDPEGTLNGCAGPAVCAFDRGAYRCAAEGAHLGRCRVEGACDPGLQCGATSRCAEVIGDGGLCDLARAASVCDVGSTCDEHPNYGPSGPGVCVRLGTRGTPCRAGVSPCDEGLACAGRRRESGLGRCRPELSRGAPCEPGEFSSACAAGTTCGPADAGGPTCADDGALHGTCRRVGAPCDAGLACSVTPYPFERTCVAELAAGAGCLVGDAAAACAAGSSCLPAGVARRCFEDGAPDGRCREASPRCDAGLACGADARCRAAVAAGGACDPRRVRDACAEPMACVRSLAAPGAECALSAYVERPPGDEAFVDACAGGTRLFGERALSVTVESARVALPFALRAYGADVTEVQVWTSGAVSLGPEPHLLPLSGSFGNFPWDGASVPLVAAFWDFLARRPGEASGVCVRTIGSAPDRRFVVGWNDVFVVSREASHLTFAVVLHEGTGVIDVRYAELRSDYSSAYVHNGSTAALGIQGRAGFDATVHRGFLTAPTAIRYAPR